MVPVAGYSSRLVGSEALDFEGLTFGCHLRTCVPARLVHLEGRAIAELGQRDGAGEVLLAADQSARSPGMKQMLRHIVAARARVKAMTGDRAQARVLCGEAWSLTDETAAGLEPDLVSVLRADMERRTSALTRTPAASGCSGALTKRELEVASALARGLSNGVSGNHGYPREHPESGIRCTLPLRMM